MDVAFFLMFLILQASYIKKSFKKNTLDYCTWDSLTTMTFNMSGNLLRFS